MSQRFQRFPAACLPQLLRVAAAALTLSLGLGCSTLKKPEVAEPVKGTVAPPASSGTAAPGMGSFGAPLEYRSGSIGGSGSSGSAIAARSAQARESRPVRIGCEIVDSFGETSSCRFLQLKMTRVFVNHDSETVDIRATEDGIFEFSRTGLEEAASVHLASSSARYRITDGERFATHSLPKRIRIERIER